MGITRRLYGNTSVLAWILFGLSVGAVWVVSVALLPTLTRAADPDLRVTLGAVAASSSATYQPTSRGPASFNSSGACPRFSGVINDTNLVTSPINSNITASNLDANDTVTFAVTLRNASLDGAAFDSMVRQSLPSGFELPGTGGEDANLCVYNGAGTSISYSSFGDGFFGPTDSDGIELTDPVGGALTPANTTSGTNIAVITFDLRLTEDYNPNSTKNLTAELLGYAAADNDDLITGATDSSSVKTGSFNTAMNLESTNQSFTPGNFVAIGEQLTYELTMAVPEGEADNVRIVDAMPEGVAFLDCLSIANNTPAQLTTNLAGGIGAACNDPTNPTVDIGTRTVTFSLGDLVNTSRDNSGDELLL